MFTSSSLELDPPIGAPGQIVVVRWRLGSDSSQYEPTTDDEIRMTTSSGELLSRISLDFTDAEQHQLIREYFAAIAQDENNNNNNNNNNGEQKQQQGDGLNKKGDQDKHNNIDKKSPNNYSAMLDRGHSVLLHAENLYGGGFYQSRFGGGQNQHNNYNKNLPFLTGAATPTLASTKAFQDLGMISTTSFGLSTTNNNNNNNNNNNIAVGSPTLSLLRQRGGLSSIRRQSAIQQPASSKMLRLPSAMNNNYQNGGSSTNYLHQQNQHQLQSFCALPPEESHASLLSGERCLRCPPFSGGFIVSLYRCSQEFQRILSVPYRVEQQQEQQDDEENTKNDHVDDSVSLAEQRKLRDLSTSSLMPENNVGVDRELKMNNSINNNNNNINNEAVKVIDVEPHCCYHDRGSDAFAANNTSYNDANNKRRPLQTVTVKFKWSDILDSMNKKQNAENDQLREQSLIFGIPVHEAQICSVLVLCPVVAPDNKGFSTEGSFLDHNNFSHCTRVVRLYQEGDSFATKNAIEPKQQQKQQSRNNKNNTTTIDVEDDSLNALITHHFVGPESAGEYECRLMVRAATNVFHTVAFSDSFTVHGVADARDENKNEKNENEKEHEENDKGVTNNNNNVAKALPIHDEESFNSLNTPRKYLSFNDEENNNNNINININQHPSIANKRKAQSVLITTAEIGKRYKETKTFYDIDEILFLKNNGCQNEVANNILIPGISPVAEAARRLRRARFGTAAASTNEGKLSHDEEEAEEAYLRRHEQHLLRNVVEEVVASPSQSPRDPASDAPSMAPPLHDSNAPNGNCNEGETIETSDSGNPSSVEETKKNAGYDNASLKFSITGFLAQCGSISEGNEQTSGMSNFLLSIQQSLAGLATNPQSNNNNNNGMISQNVRIMENCGYSTNSSKIVNLQLHSPSPLTINSLPRALKSLQQTKLIDNPNQPNSPNAAPASISATAPPSLHLEASRYRVMAGQYILIRYDVRAASYGNEQPQPVDVARRRLPSSLDHIRFTPFGRSECDVYSGSTALTITGHSSHAGVVCVKTPNASGCFDLGFRRFSDNETLVLAKHPVVTDWPDGEITVMDYVADKHNNHQDDDSKKKSSLGEGNGEETENRFAKFIHQSTVYVKIKPGFMASPHDRIVAFDETAAVVAFSLVEWDAPGKEEMEETDFDLRFHSPSINAYYSRTNHDQQPFPSSSSSASPTAAIDKNARSGKAVLQIPISGRFNIRLVSARVGFVLPCKCRELLTVPASATYPLPYASLMALRIVPGRAADIGISFVKLLDVEDVRPIEIQMRDCVVVTPYGSDQHFSTPTHFDDPNAQQFLRCNVVYNAMNKFIVFDIRNLKSARYMIRFMVGTSNPFVRVCTSECSFDICDKGADFVAEYLATSGGELEVPRDCDMHTSQLFIERLSASELARVRHLRRSAAEIASVARSKHHTDNNSSFSNGAMNPTTAPSSALAVIPFSPTASSSSSSSMSFVEKRRALLQGLSIHPPIILPRPHEIEGHLLPPLVVTAGDVFRIAVNIAVGAPRLNDLVVLCSEDLTKVFTQVSIANCMDFAKSPQNGEAVLYAPSLPGKCVAVYYSQAAKGGLFASNVIKVKKNALQKQQQQQQQKILNQRQLLNDAASNKNSNNYSHSDASAATKKKGRELSDPTLSSSPDTDFHNIGNEQQQNDGGEGSQERECSILDLRKVFEKLTRRRLSPDGLQQYSDDVDAPLFGIMKQPSKLIAINDNENNPNNSNALISPNSKRMMMFRNNNNNSIIARSPFHNSSNNSNYNARLNPVNLASTLQTITNKMEDDDGVNNNNNNQQQQPMKTVLVTTNTRPPRLRVLLVGVSYLKQRYDLDGPANDVAAMFQFFKQNFSSSSTSSAMGTFSDDDDDDYIDDEQYKKNINNNNNNNSEGVKKVNFLSGEEKRNKNNHKSKQQRDANSQSTPSLDSFDSERDARVLHESCDDPLLRPTATNIRDGIEWLIDGAEPHDHLVFYFSGSGALVPQVWNWYNSKKKEQNDESTESHSSNSSNSSSSTGSDEDEDDEQKSSNQNTANSRKPVLFKTKMAMKNSKPKKKKVQKQKHSSNSSSSFVSTEVSQVLLPSDFDFGRRVISYSEILRDLYGNVAHIADITVTSIVDAGFAADATNIMEQRRGVDLQDAVVELGQTLLAEERKKVFNGKSKCRCVPPPEPLPLVSIAADQASVEAPSILIQRTNKNEKKRRSNRKKSTRLVKQFVLDGLSPTFVPTCSSQAISYFPSSSSSRHCSYDNQKPKFNVPKNSFFFEASRGGGKDGDGRYAWDAFSRWAGVSMGLFTNTLVSVLNVIVAEKRDGLVGVTWFDLFERVQREMRHNRGGQLQLPLLWTARCGFSDGDDGNDADEGGKNNKSMRRHDDLNYRPKQNNKGVKSVIRSPFLSQVFPLARDTEFDE